MAQRVREASDEATATSHYGRCVAVVVVLHPGALKRHQQQLDRLAESISKAVDAGDVKLAAAIRDLVESVTVQREAKRVRVEISGRVNALLGDQHSPMLVRGMSGDRW